MLGLVKDFKYTYDFTYILLDYRIIVDECEKAKKRDRRRRKKKKKLKPVGKQKSTMKSRKGKLMYEYLNKVYA